VQSLVAEKVTAMSASEDDVNMDVGLSDTGDLSKPEEDQLLDGNVDFSALQGDVFGDVRETASGDNVSELSDSQLEAEDDGILSPMPSPGTPRSGQPDSGSEPQARGEGSSVDVPMDIHEKPDTPVARDSGARKSPPRTAVAQRLFGVSPKSKARTSGITESDRKASESAQTSETETVARVAPKPALASETSGKSRRASESGQTSEVPERRRRTSEPSRVSEGLGTPRRVPKGTAPPSEQTGKPPATEASQPGQSDSGVRDTVSGEVAPESRRGRRARSKDSAPSEGRTGDGSIVPFGEPQQGWARSW